MGACYHKRNIHNDEPITPNTHPKFDWAQSSGNQSIVVERNSFYSELIDTIDIIVVGNNEHGELGLGHTDNIDSMTVLNSLPKDEYSEDITIHSGYKFTIYTNISGEHECNHHWAAGSNSHGECCFNITKNATKCNAIQYFTDKHINILKICVSIGGQSVFWISDTFEVYGNGNNDYGQLGLNDCSRTWKPRKIPFFKNKYISDIQCARHYSVALCTTNYNSIITIIIKHILRTVHVHVSLQHIPKVVLDLIISFYRINNVYSTEFSKYGGNGHEFIHRWNKYGEIRTRWSWKEIKTLRDRDIIKIKTGRNHTLFLDTQGVVWCCGINVNGGLGLGHCNDVYEPTQIQWFIENNIIIMDISTGSDHNLAIDQNNKVYCWGANHVGQCGDSSTNHVDIPKMIKYFKNCFVKQIDCGTNHSYVLIESQCKNERDKHYLFGSNKYNECITYDNTILNGHECYCNTKITTPHCINDIVEYKSGGKTIKEVYLGHHNTKVILVDM